MVEVFTMAHSKKCVRDQCMFVLTFLAVQLDLPANSLQTLEGEELSD